MNYDHLAIEKKWQERWLKNKVFSVPNVPDHPGAPRHPSSDGRRGVYVLDMFPYPSGDGLHVGHPEGYTATDIYARFRRMNGDTVLHPMGWDAFGLPAENAAIKKGIHPRIVTEQNVKNFKRQIQAIGFSYDWDREINTTDPKYYKWTQWIFLQLYKRGLAYEKESPIWWCPKDKTGLANEEVVNGCCERCGTKVEKKMLRQWVLKITAYADRLLAGLEKLDWPESIKALQRNWIGRSEGAEVRFRIKVEGLKSKDEEVAVFTTRPDTLFGATYLVLSPEHPLVDVITTKEHKKKVEGYKIKVLSKSDLERTALEKEKTGVFTGAYAVNPVNKEKIPVWIADYVLMSYGAGAIMAVPAHDERDFAFAKKFKLPIVKVITPPAPPLTQGGDEGGVWTGEGVMQNSGEFNGLPSEEGRKKIVEWLAGKQNPASANCIIVHGCPDRDENASAKRTYDKHWMPWLKKELGKHSIDAKMPLMPTPWKPLYGEWKKEFKKLPINENTILIGHSCGSAFLVRWLSETKKKIRALILVAPWKDVDHANAVKRDFYTFAIDKGIADRTDSITIFTSDNEDEEGKEFAKQYHQALSGKLITLSGRGHYTLKDMGTPEFPELLHLIQSQTVTGARAKLAVQYKLRDWVFSRQRYWGEPIPLVKCESCKLKVERTKWVLNFYEKPWHALQTGEKTIETRALNPDEPDRYFGDVREGDVIKGVLKGTGEVMYLRVTKRHVFKNLEELHRQKDVLKKLRKDFAPTLDELKKFYALTPDYVERIQKNGMVAWEVEHVIPGVVPIPEKDLPVLLPDVEKYEPTGTGESPLAGIKEWVNVKCPRCGKPAKRETNTMPQWAGSCWYYIRFTDPHNDEAMASPEAMKAWLPVDLYVGGAEHAVLHLLYARFWHMALYDAGVIPKECDDEPFTKLKNQGLILGSDGEKMSKSRGNVINPDDIIEKYGADTLRMYEMFMGPFEDAKPWSAESIVGVRRFLEKVWRAGSSLDEKLVSLLAQQLVSGEIESDADEHRVHRYTKLVGEGIYSFRFNTCVSGFMKWSNEWKDGVSRGEFEVFLKLLSPFAPHITQELWSRLGHNTQLTQESWPKLDPKKIKEETVTIAVQVMGKLRGTVTVNTGADQKAVESAAKAEPNVAKYLTGEPKPGGAGSGFAGKVIFVKDRLINFVV